MTTRACTPRQRPLQSGAVPVETEPDFEAGAPQVLFGGNFVATTGRMYDVSPDGQRFVVVRAAPGNDGETEVPQVVLVQNWFEELKRLVPTD